MSWFKWDPERNELSPGLGELNLSKKKGQRKPNFESVRITRDADGVWFGEMSGIDELSWIDEYLIVGKMSEFYETYGFFEPVKLQMR